jgi:hypothetical protein
MVATEREPSRSELQALYDRAERRIELCAFEVRRQDRQWSAFREEQHRVFVVNTSGNDSSSTAVFHGAKVETVRERMMREHREQELEEQRDRERKERRATLAVRRRAGLLHFCRHCNVEMFRGLPGDKCQRCKDDPALVTARGKETRSSVPRREAQPDVTPLSPGAERMLALIASLEHWMWMAKDAIELRYFERLSDHSAAEKMRVPTRVFIGYARAGVTRVAYLLANPAMAP